MSRKACSIPLVLFIAIFAVACRDAAGPEYQAPADGRGFTLLLTDAPGDFEAAVVTISRIYLQGAGGRVVLRDEPFTGDLLMLRNDVATLVQGLDVPAGAYSELRLVIDGAYVQVETETGSRIFASSPDYDGLPSDAQGDGTLHMPSFSASGLKVKLPGGRLEIGEGETVVLVDFNVQESFGHQAGRSGRWIMRPVIRATDVTFGGRVLARLQLGSGVDLPELDGQAVTLAAFEARLTPAAGGTAREIPLTDADGDGAFEAMFKGVAPGEYELDFVGPAGIVATFDPTIPQTVTVLARETVTETFTVASAALAGTVVATLRLGSGVTLPSIGGNPVTLAQFEARLTPAAGGATIEVSFSDANEDGTFEAEFANLFPGDYSLDVAVPDGVSATFDPALPLTVTVAPGATETRPLVITAASTS